MTLPLYDVSALSGAECLTAFDSLETENAIWDKLDIGHHHPASCGDGDCIHVEAGHAILRRALQLQGLDSEASP